MKLLVLGACSLLLFWAPLVSPFVQGWTLVEACLALRRGADGRRVGRWRALFTAACALAGFALFLATEYLWLS